MGGEGAGEGEEGRKREGGGGDRGLKRWGREKGTI